MSAATGEILGIAMFAFSAGFVLGVWFVIKGQDHDA